MEADAYPDSSFLVSLSRDDANHDAAMRYMAHSLQTLAFTPLHRIELFNSLRVAAARGEINQSELQAAFRKIDGDLRDGLLVHTPVGWTDVFRCADELSDQHAAADGQRTIDLLHVALALESGAKLFLSFDQRQRTLAKLAGMKVKP